VVAVPSLDDHFQLFCRFVENKSNDTGHISLSLTGLTVLSSVVVIYDWGEQDNTFQRMVDIDMTFEY
jgi:hypothetical protein